MNSFNSFLAGNLYTSRSNNSNNGQAYHTANGIEQAIRSSHVPIASNEAEETNALGYRGVLLNKNEIQNWRGTVPIDRYKLNHDPNPEVIKKKSSQPIEYNQDITIKWLRPPTFQSVDIIIKQQPDTILPAAPPMVIRQNAPEPHAPETSNLKYNMRFFILFYN